MQKHLGALLCALLLAILCPAALAQEVETPYTGVVSRELTMRQTQSKSAKKVGSVEQYETIQIMELGDEWVLIQKDGTSGYVLASYVYNVAAFDGSLVPEPFDTRTMEIPVLPDGETVLYTGTATTDLTVRQTKSRSGKKLESVSNGETVQILELDKEWFMVRKDDAVGYILAKHVKDLTAAMDGVFVPEEYIEEVEPEFIELYSATAKVNLSVRKEKDRESRMLATLYEDETVSVSTVDGEWALVKKGKAVGYVLSEHLKQFKAIDPYAALIPGAQIYPYAATVTREITVYEKGTGQPLQSLPAGSVIAVSEPLEDGRIELPYKRTTAVVNAQDVSALSFAPVSSWDEASAGALLCVFSTFFDVSESSEILEGRRFNMLEGVRRIGGTVLRAGERFSFNDLAGPYTKGNGYMKGPIINYTSSEKTGYGGGICQISTTLYNAILQIPIRIVRSQPHSSVGIDYAPVDFDAAVGAGNLDLRFDNQLDYPIRIDIQMTDGVVSVMIYRNE